MTNSIETDSAIPRSEPQVNSGHFCFHKLFHRKRKGHPILRPLRKSAWLAAKSMVPTRFYSDVT